MNGADKVRVNCKKFDEMLNRTIVDGKPLSYKKAADLIGCPSGYFSDQMQKRYRKCTTMILDRVEKICVICGTDYMTILSEESARGIRKQAKEGADSADGDEPESYEQETLDSLRGGESYEQETLDLETDTRIDIDIPDFYKQGIASITLIEATSYGAKAACVFMIDLKKSHHWVLSEDGIQAVTEEAENGKT